MKVLLRVIGGLLLVAAIATLRYQVRPAAWKTTVLDTKHPKRFVEIVLDQGKPLIIYFNEQEGGGVLYQQAKKSSFSLINNLGYYQKNGQREWKSGVIDDQKFSGMFLKAVAGKDKVHLVYQDATPGKEKLIYATPGRDGWEKEVVDSVETGGNDVGVYASISLLDGKPVIFYHTTEGQKFSYAKKENGSWVRQQVETGTGWMTSSGSCDDKVLVAYRDRGNQGMYFGVLAHSWNNRNDSLGAGNWLSRPLEASTSSGLSLAIKNCQPYLAYFDDSLGEVRFIDLDVNQSFPIDQGRLTQVSLATNKDGFHVAYYVRGLKESHFNYAFSKDGREWRTERLADGRADGWFNSIVADDEGNVYVAFLDETSLKYAEYNVSSVRLVRKLKNILLTAFSTAALTMFLAGWKDSFLPWQRRIFPRRNG